LAKSVLGFEEAARQLLFLRSGKSSLESNLPVCYCIRTSSLATLRYLPPPSLASAPLLRSLQQLRPLLRAHAGPFDCTWPPFAWKRANFACTRVDSLNGNSTQTLLARP
jgi:hypothetical protein